MRFLPLLLLLSASAIAAPIVDDHFTSPKLPVRDLSPSRGEWKIANGIATCTQDDALYAKNKNHGPVIWYKANFTDATIRFSVRPQRTQTFVFTLNDEKGHVFRYVLTPTALGIRAWKEQGHDAKPDVLPAAKDAPKLVDGECLSAELTFASDRCTLKLGPTYTQELQHPSLAKPKTTMGLGFAFGTLSVRDVSIVTP